MTNAIQSSLQWVIYPLVMLSGLIGYLFLQANYSGVIWIAYIPVLVATIVVTGLEILIPHKRAWLPNQSDIKTDTAYMLFVQVGVPLILGIGLVSMMHAPISEFGSKTSGWWPHHWPLLAQGGVMLLVAEFFSYWLHRLAHTLPVLWRFHAVHHSSEKLYWLNVGRFHPLEKILQYVVSTFPFMLMGVSQDVLGLYFVFYGINGFFQHSNIKIKYGVLNYLVSSATLHRWHHSPNIAEANHNYGNNLIVWDLLFGTWFLPRDRQINEVGSGMQNYPKSFARQLVKPFEGIAANMRSRISYFISMLVIKIVGNYLIYRYWKPFIKKSKNPEIYQQNILKKIIHNNARTRFGRLHGFSRIKTETKFKLDVPIMQYEDIEAFLTEQAITASPVLYNDKPLFYARTSGTTGRPKDIPVTKNSLSELKRQQRLLTSYQYQLCPEAFSGKALGLVSPAIEGYRDDDISYGSASGYVYKTMPALIKNRYVVPAEVFDITDYEMKYRVICRLALAEENLTYLGTANPSTFLRIRQLLTDEWETLLTSLKTGVLEGVETLPEDLQTLLNTKIRPELARYEKLKKLNYSEYREFKDIWPSIRMLTTWTGGNCQVALERLNNSLPNDVKLIELGYVASELRSTITCDPKTNAGIPVLDQNYYEFIEKHDWDNGHRETLGMSELELGKHYYIIVTTNYGLYRYFMNDLVEVCGVFQNTPLIKFIQKGNGVTNITGEKVYENQLNEAILDSCTELDLQINFHITLANVVQARYEVYVELESNEMINIYVLAHAIDKNLSKLNIEYSEKRKSGRLLAPAIYSLNRGTAEEYKQYQVSRGQREGQYKLVTLLDKSQFKFPIQDYLARVDEEDARHASN